ncbi:MAG: conjugal transfer protein TraG N-terminal domain-containing protein, partial [Xanthomonadales bacterium]|nr:conjugal transfer protein TraG N-terminal domain-containing protein [Xanthomonadales bacterium]
MTTKWLDPVGGSSSERSCEFAYNNLQNYYNGAGFFSDWAKSVAGRNGQLGSAPPVNSAAYGFAAVGLSLTDAQSYVKANIINRAWAAAIPNIPYVGGEQARQFAMIASAAEQSATQHAGEETMFRRLMRPMMAFFECMVYAAAPFMALVAGFGMVGFRLLGKYALVTLWVALWIPVLAIINQFQLTMAERAITLVTNTPSGGTGLPIGSLTGANAVHNAAIDWINTGSMLAASTPAITLMLLFGSAMTAVGLAQALKGGDHLNEKTVSPDATKPAAVEDGRAMLSTSYAGGTSVAGAPIPTMSFGSTVQTSAASAQSASENALVQYGKTGAVQAARASAIDTATGMAANKNQNLTLSQNETDVFNSAMGNDTSFNAASAATKRLASRSAGQIVIEGTGRGSLHPQRLPRQHLAVLHEHDLPRARFLGRAETHAVALRRDVFPALVLAAVAADRHDADPVAAVARAAETYVDLAVDGRRGRHVQRRLCGQHLHRPGGGDALAVEQDVAVFVVARLERRGDGAAAAGRFGAEIGIGDIGSGTAAGRGKADPVAAIERAGGLDDDQIAGHHLRRAIDPRLRSHHPDRARIGHALAFVEHVAQFVVAGLARHLDLQRFAAGAQARVVMSDVGPRTLARFDEADPVFARHRAARDHCQRGAGDGAVRRLDRRFQIADGQRHPRQHLLLAAGADVAQFVLARRGRHRKRDAAFALAFGFRHVGVGQVAAIGGIGWHHGDEVALVRRAAPGHGQRLGDDGPALRGQRGGGRRRGRLGADTHRALHRRAQFAGIASVEIAPAGVLGQAA